ncbi:MAG TPA: hypothetical protein VE031_13505 [Chthoniobacterales bacterium]|nr:hypothetical protein [Chthoniobacterales bacterium]
MIKPSLQKLTVAAFCIFSTACSALTVVRPLSRADAVRIADAEARRYTHASIREYMHSPVLYAAERGAWYVGYRRPGQKFVDFGIDVDDKTRKARVLMY